MQNSMIYITEAPGCSYTKWYVFQMNLHQINMASKTWKGNMMVSQYTVLCDCVGIHAT